MNLKPMKIFEVGAIITAITIVVLTWFISFVADTYKVNADVSNLKEDIQEIKQDTNFIRNYLLEKKDAK
jgi:cell division protein FtsL